MHKQPGALPIAAELSTALLLQKMKISVGEPIVGTYHNTSGTYSQGFFKAKPTQVVEPGSIKYAFYPNPFRNELTLQGDLTKVKQVQLYDIAGRKVLDVSYTTNKLYINQLNAGIYTARLIGDNSTVLYYVKLSKL